MPCDLKEEKEFLKELFLELCWFLRVQNFIVLAVRVLFVSKK